MGLLLPSSPRGIRAARKETLERRRLFLGLLEPVNDCTVAEQARRHQWGVQEERFLDIGQGQPQMPLCGHHGCHRQPDDSGGLLGGTEGQICGLTQLFDVVGRRGSKRLGGQCQSLEGQCSAGRQIAHKRLFYPGHRPIAVLLQSHNVRIIDDGRAEEME